jgi:hypothetical protein
LQGVYVSKDEPGILVFRSDGVLGYKIPTKHFFYTTDKLPPDTVQYRVGKDGLVELVDAAEDLGFSLRVADKGRTVVLTRVKATGGLPRRAVYRRQ